MAYYTHRPADQSGSGGTGKLAPFAAGGKPCPAVAGKNREPPIHQQPARGSESPFFNGQTLARIADAGFLRFSDLSLYRQTFAHAEKRDQILPLGLDRNSGRRSPL